MSHLGQFFFVFARNYLVLTIAVIVFGVVYVDMVFGIAKFGVEIYQAGHCHKLIDGTYVCQ